MSLVSTDVRVARHMGPLLLACGLACADEPLVSATADTTGPGPTGPTSFVPEPTTGTGDASGEGPTTGVVADLGDGETGGTSGPAGSFCGDGIVDADEACDDGPANGDQAYCTMQCTLNYCGDGMLLVGHELCDAGAANHDGYGATCTDECRPGERCGDNIVQPAYETCDLGPDNGTDVGDAQGILCAANCRQQARRGFVTSASFTGDLGGVLIADARCRELATAAGDPRADAYHAFLSTAEQSVAARFAPLLGEPLPYVTPSGEKFADSFAALLADGPLGAGISVDETGATRLGVRVLTGTAPGGTTFDPELDCAGWTSADKQLGARAGLSFPSDPELVASWVAEGWWTSFTTTNCDKELFHLYCLEL